MSARRRPPRRPSLAGPPTEHVKAVGYYENEFHVNKRLFYEHMDHGRCGAALDLLVDAAKAKQGLTLSVRWSGRQQRPLDQKRFEIQQRLMEMTDIYASRCVR